MFSFFPVFGRMIPAAEQQQQIYAQPQYTTQQGFVRAPQPVSVLKTSASNSPSLGRPRVVSVLSGPNSAASSVSSPLSPSEAGSPLRLFWDSSQTTQRPDSVFILLTQTPLPFIDLIDIVDADRDPEVVAALSAARAHIGATLSGFQKANGLTPFLEDGETVVFTAECILRYLAQKFLNKSLSDLHWYPTDLKRRTEVEQVLTFSSVLRWCDPQTSATLLSVLQDGFLRSNSFISGEEISIADLALFETLSNISAATEPYPLIHKWQQQISELIGQPPTVRSLAVLESPLLPVGSPMEEPLSQLSLLTSSGSSPQFNSRRYRSSSIIEPRGVAAPSSSFSSTFLTSSGAPGTSVNRLELMTRLATLSDLTPTVVASTAVDAETPSQSLVSSSGFDAAARSRRRAFTVDSGATPLPQQQPLSSKSPGTSSPSLKTPPPSRSVSISLPDRSQFAATLHAKLSPVTTVPSTANARKPTAPQPIPQSTSHNTPPPSRTGSLSVHNRSSLVGILGPSASVSDPATLQATINSRLAAAFQPQILSPPDSPGTGERTPPPSRSASVSVQSHSRPVFSLDPKTGNLVAGSIQAAELTTRLAATMLTSSSGTVSPASEPAITPPPSRRTSSRVPPPYFPQGRTNSGKFSAPISSSPQGSHMPDPDERGAR
eukprot:TRINITY_DN4021_c0_g1_i1.p1 TRINITY_DN4021_c0_g1~~TRINITY_DN4021_c0_g1_i1.p1  ORF type:complete len:661 (-),score=115.51 TRINITY_DN4021_c0_g1_i1:100-2082(-)